MSKREIAILACKIISIYTLIKAISTYPLLYNSFIFWFHNQNQEQISIIKFIVFLIAQFAPLVVLLLFTIALWFFAERISLRMIKGADSSSIELNVQSIAFSIVGLIIVAQAIPDLGRVFFSLLYKAKLYSDISPGVRQDIWSADAWGHMASATLRIAIGLWLLLGSYSFARMIKKIRA